MTAGRYRSAVPSLRTSRPHDSFGTLGESVLDDLASDGLGHYHQTVRSMERSTSSSGASQKSAETYFQPASASTVDDHAFVHLLGDPPRDVHRGAARDAGEDALEVEQRPHAAHRLLVRDEQLPVELARRRGSAARSRRRASEAPSRGRPAAARPRRRRGRGTTRAGGRRCPSACRRCRGRRRARRRGRAPRRSPRRCPRSAPVGWRGSRTGTA